MENIVDLVLSIYFSADASLMSFDQFLLKVAENMGINLQQFEGMDLRKKKDFVYGFLAKREQPLIYLDNYETVSMSINDESKEPNQDAVDISDFLNNGLPSNTSILVTSRELHNNFNNEKIVLLEGLDKEESIKMFVGRVADKSLLDLSDSKVKSAIDKVIEMTGGHPLSIEVISKNISSVEEIDDMTFNSKIKKVNRNEPNKRLQSLNASFNYTIDKLDNTLKQTLTDLLLFKSPFPISAAMEILAVTRGDIINLHNRSLITRVTIDDVYGPIKDIEYWLYTFHPATRNYLQSKNNDLFDLEKRYGEKFYRYYYHLLENTYKSI